MLRRFYPIPKKGYQLALLVKPLKYKNQDHKGLANSLSRDRVALRHSDYTKFSSFNVPQRAGLEDYSENATDDCFKV
jgi:hypothetical protein